MMAMEDPDPASTLIAPTVVVDISIADSGWQDVDIDLQHLSDQAATLALSDHDLDHAEITIAFGSDAWIKQLNQQFRGIDKATNVLAFPDSGSGTYLGDLALARETVIQEANAENKSLTDHLSHLIVHGCLHLLGYDHLVNDDAEQMEALEIQLLARIGITNPYQEMIDPLATAPGRQKNP